LGTRFQANPPATDTTPSSANQVSRPRVAAAPITAASSSSIRPAIDRRVTAQPAITAPTRPTQNTAVALPSATSVPGTARRRSSRSAPPGISAMTAKATPLTAAIEVTVLK